MNLPEMPDSLRTPSELEIRKAKHTPGPWMDAGSARDESNRLVSEITTENGTLICSVEFLTTCDATDHYLPSPNVPLIATAPELLAAVKDIIDTVRRCDECDGSGKGWNDRDACGSCGGTGEQFHAEGLAVAARAAIAKAEGTKG